MPSRLYFFAIPLLLVFVPALLSIIRRSDDMSRWHKFLVVALASSMVLTGLGALASTAVNLAYGTIPGTASYGGHTGDNYYFYSRRRQLATPVPRETWEQAFFDEQVAAHLLYIPVATFAGSLLTLYLTRRWFRTDPDADPIRYRPPLRLRFRLETPIAPVLCVMGAFLVGDFILTTVVTDVGVNPAAAHMLLVVATIFLGAIASMVTQSPPGTIVAIPLGFLFAYVATRMVAGLIRGATLSPAAVPFALDVVVALLFGTLLFAVSYKLVSKWTEVPNRWR